MAIKSNFKNMVVCLFATCLCCSAILAGVYAVTAEPISQTNAKILKASIGAVLPQGGEISEAKPIEVGGQPSEYYECTKEGQIIAYAVKSSVVGFGGPLVLMVGVTEDGVVYNTSVFSHTETPGLGAKCTSDQAFVEQWKGLNPKEMKLSVKKDGGDIDAITASTITSRAYTQAVSNAIAAISVLNN